MPKIKNMGTSTMRFKEGIICSGSANETALSVYGNASGDFVATIDNDENTNGHVLKLLTDGNGSGSRLLDMEDGDGDIIFRARADGRFGFGPDGVSSMGAGTFVVGIDNSSHTADIAISQRLQHLGDSNTYLDFPSADTFNLVAGGGSFLKYDNSSSKIIINNANENRDTQIMADDGNVVLHVDAGNNTVGIGTASPSQILTLDATEPTILFKEGGTDMATIGVNSSDNILLENKTMNKHIVFKVNDQGVVKEGFRLDGAVPEVVVNQTSDSLVDFRVESDNQTHMLFVDGSSDKVGIKTSSPISELDVAGKIAISAESSTPSQPSDGQGFIYSKSDGKLYWRSYDLAETELTAAAAGGGGGAGLEYAVGHVDLTTNNKPVNWVNASSISASSGIKSWFIVPKTTTIDKVIVSVKGNNFNTSNDGNVTLSIYKNQQDYGSTVFNQTVGADDFTEKVSNMAGGTTDCDQKIFTGLNVSVAEGDLIHMKVGKSAGSDKEALVTVVFNSGGSSSSGLSLTAQKNSNYTAANGEMVLVNLVSASGDVTVTLPAASSDAQVAIKIAGLAMGKEVIVDGNSSQTIDGLTTRVMNTDYESMHLISDGSNWWRIS